MRKITIAIDGPAASGKSTTARSVADRLGYCHLNSGLLYRAITWAGIEGGWLDDPERFDREVSRLDLGLEKDPPTYRVRIGSREVGAALTAAETSARVSAVSADPGVRAKVLVLLRPEGESGGIVCDGRDIGTVVFPEAELKIYLRATATERARRRLLERGVEPTPAMVQEEVIRLSARDEVDSRRDHSPLRKAADAIELDTTSMRPSAVVDRIVALAHEAVAHLG